MGLASPTLCRGLPRGMRFLEETDPKRHNCKPGWEASLFGVETESRTEYLRGHSRRPRSQRAGFHRHMLWAPGWSGPQATAFSYLLSFGGRLSPQQSWRNPRTRANIGLQELTMHRSCGGCDDCPPVGGAPSPSVQFPEQRAERQPRVGQRAARRQTLVSLASPEHIKPRHTAGAQ